MPLFNRTGQPEDVEERSLISIGDPAFLEFFNIGTTNLSGITVTETGALAIAAVWRAVSLISQTIASLPARDITHNLDGTRERNQSWIDNPGAPLGMTQFEFYELISVHMLLHGNAFCMHIRNGSGGMLGLQPLHPTSVAVERKGYDKFYTVQMADGAPKVFTDDELLHIPALCTDGVRGLGPLQVARQSLGTAIAADNATASMFSNGAFIKGIITPDEDVTEEEATEIKAMVDRNIHGYENAGGWAVTNRRLKFQEWMMTNQDAQFLESRMFQIEEIARWFGIPPFELMQTDKQTSWGTGIEAQQQGLSRQVIGPWVTRIEQRMSTLLPTGREVEFDFAALERPNPEEEIRLLIEQVAGGLMTQNEARAIRNMPPHPDGDTLLLSAQTRAPVEGDDNAE